MSCAPVASARSTGSIPLVSGTSREAPKATKHWTVFACPPRTAPCIAVSPAQPRVFTSACKRRRASTMSDLPSAAAATSNVVPSASPPSLASTGRPAWDTNCSMACTAPTPALIRIASSRAAGDGDGALPEASWLLVRRSMPSPPCDDGPTDPDVTTTVSQTSLVSPQPGCAIIRKARVRTASAGPEVSSPNAEGRAEAASARSTRKGDPRGSSLVPMGS
mmetsp:Transcript_88647/g.202770  ORF Transcript_88647/g.202770 Transcript_88647/m.202770 type:complete len:220 (+) Transcript_88647:691-1350(+)